MKLELKRRVLKVDVYGENVEIDFPTVKQYRDYQEVVRTNKEELGDFDLMKNFVVSLGFKGELIDSLEPDHLMKVVNALTGASEKK